ncbi:tRNA (guanosine(46)-N7)-methyltransferase TrmB [Fodinibius salsisoli]|uniref:tRNA (guanine-N(7)-)-methyltransferase n=1 Tax=Fodinibius salsisoli TaxID=2820877 RepID=A0ABT3PJ65_9BACT|nr:tRNA (guanosine(46)-N7)-methyltransferase TrmB [Fodinibius salsisoli]MCW9705979.1 tRNA (guanosine(46)-N7)-methyltransferase TrmB [Fodinibius salsisoli]
MGKKLDRFQDIAAFQNVSEYTDFQSGEVQKPRGRWNTDVFENDHPITLELACGKGEYTLELSDRYPEKNIIGIDIKGARIWKGASKALKKKRANVHFLRTYIDHLDEYFDPGEVHDIWITFPDPYPKGSDRNKRLTSPKFLAIYQKVLVPNGRIRLKTDSNQLFSYTQWAVKETGCKTLDIVENIYDERPDDPLLTHKTYFEKKHLKKGRTISYIEFSVPEIFKTQS